MLSEYQKGLRPISEAWAVSGHLVLVRVSGHLVLVRVSGHLVLVRVSGHLVSVRVWGLQAAVHRASGRLAWVRVCLALVLARVLVCRASVSVRALVYRALVLVQVRVWGRVLVCRVSVPVWGRGDVSDQRGHRLPRGFRPWLRRLRKAQ